MEENTIHWDTVRTEFPALRDRVFLDAACVSVMPQRAHATVTHFSGELLLPSEHNSTGHHIWMDAQRARTPPEVAKLLGVDQRHIALVESTTHGLNIAAQAISWQRGDEILMCDLEFLQVAIPFVKLAERGEVTTRFLKHRDGVVDADAFISAIGAKTRAIVVSSTQWSNGYRLDLGKLGAACRSAGVWLVVDGIQQAGAIPFDLTGVDFLTAGGHKWLNAPMGAGFLYLSQRVLDQLEPAGWGYLSLEDPEGGWSEYFTTPAITPDRAYGFDRSARRFEIGGTSNYPGAICLGKSLELVNQIGIDNIANRVWELGDRLIEGLRTIDVKLETDFDRQHRAGIISFTTGSKEGDAACLESLLARDICVAQRYTANTGGVRISVHYFNNERDIDLLLEGLADFRPQCVTARQ